MRFLLATVAVFITSPAAAFDSFSNETKLIGDLIKCPSARISSDPGLPDLWSCILPGAEVVKVFVNSDESGGVANVKFMWNDWTRDTGYGIHTDEDIARAWLSAISTHYAPKQVEEVLEAFSSSSDITIVSERYILTYTYYKGPAIDERLFIITKSDD